MALDSMKEIAECPTPFWQIVLETDMDERQVTAEASMEKMRRT